jgi:hypothetical protein
LAKACAGARAEALVARRGRAEENISEEGSGEEGE